MIYHRRFLAFGAALSVAFAAPACKSNPTAAANKKSAEALPQPLTAPAGFTVSVFASHLIDARMMVLDPSGQVVVAERGRGRVVRLPDLDGDGVSDTKQILADGFDQPSSVAFHPDGSMYVAETKRVWRLTQAKGNGSYQQRKVIVDGLPSGGHNTRTLLLSKDGTSLYLSVGSSCNVCRETDSRRATVMRYQADGKAESNYARGLRNAVGMVFRPGTEEIWVSNNGRDWLGDELPPETIYHIKQGDNAGWPVCHAGRLTDPDLGKPDSCDGILAPKKEMPAHSAPLGLRFYDGTMFPTEYRGDLFVAFHGSWNRSKPTGYKVVRINMTADQAGETTDFVHGWMQSNGKPWGRPVDVLVARDGSLLISDDYGGRIFRVAYTKAAASTKP